MDGGTPRFEGLNLLSNGFGLQSRDAAPVVHNGQIAGNASYGIVNLSLAPLVQAQGNWWGHASGPADPIGNTGGAGDLVTGGVDYAGWLAGIPLLQPALALASTTGYTEQRQIELALSCRNAVAFRLAENGSFGTQPFLPITPSTVFTLSPGDGLKQVSVEYRASSGNTTTATIPGGVLYDTLGPVVRLTQPEAGAVVTRAITLEATAQDPAGVQRVEFYVDDLRIGTDTTSPFTQPLALDGLADGTHTIKVAAVDALGRTTGDSRGITVRKPVASIFAVDSRASIYGAGHSILHDPTALAPVQLRFAPGVGKALTIADVTGQVSNGTGSNSADGGSGNTNVAGLVGLSGIRVDGRRMFLAGVFLSDAEPYDPPPPPVDLGSNTSFAQFAPVMGQVFYIGDGLTGFGNGQPQLFVVPPGATRLFLGFVDTGSDGSTPGGYGDNIGVLSARASIEENAITDLTGPALSAVSFAGAPLNAGQILARNGALSVVAVDPSGVARVDFLIDGSVAGSDANGSDGYRLPLNLYALNDGAHALAVRAYDTLGNTSELSRNVTVALAAPAAPSIATPAPGSSTASKTTQVTGTAEIGARVQLYVNGSARGSELTVDSGGGFSATLALTDGANRVQAAALNRGGTSTLSAEVLVTLDASIPAAPAGLTAAAQPSGGVRLTWQRASGGGVKGYHVYRAATPFTDAAQAVRVNTALLTAAGFDDLPPADGGYFYRVIAVNAVDTASVPSNQASTVADRTAPRALAIEYHPTGAYDSANGRFGRGNVDVTLRLSESPAATPFLSIAPAGGGPITLSLVHVSDTEYRGSFAITEHTLSGTAYAVFSARDAVGNRGTDIAAGGSLLIDAAGPAVTALSVAPAEPIKNDRASPTAVVVDFALSEAMKPGEIPQLSYLLSGTGRMPVAIGNVTATGPTSYRATFTLLDDAGLAGIEQLSFAFAGRDDLENTSSHILAANRFQVYQGELPPAAVPTGLAAHALPAGKVELSWNPAQDAAAYQLYRQAPGETELTPYKRLPVPGYLDAAASDGVHRYAVASIRAHNSQESVSARSATVEALADATRPDAPRDLLLGLTGTGIVAVWKAPAATDVAGFNVYRSSASAITSMDGLTPLRTKVQALSFIDGAPSVTEHSYVVTALDAAGNESPISNSAYLNATLLPVNSLKVVQTGDALPVLSWTHPTGAVAGYDVYVGPDNARVKLNANLLTEQTFTDGGYTGAERRYSVVAVDSNAQEIARTLTLPRTQLKPVGGFPVRRGIFNRLDYQLSNLGSAAVQNARLRIMLGTHSHLSQPFFVNAGETKVVSVVVGGYPDLDASTPLITTIEISPNDGERVEIARSIDAQVADGSLTLSVQSESLTRGNTGKVRFTLSNSSAVETQIVTARALGQQPSDQVRVRLADRDGNVLVSQPLLQVDAGVETYSSGVTVARLAPGASFTSAPVDIAVSSGAPDDILVQLYIDQLHYRLGEPEQVALPGLSSSLSARLQDNAYYAQVTGIDPPVSYGDSSIVIRGRTLERRSAQPLSSVPLKLVLAVEGFERVLDLYSDASGSFTHIFTPQKTDAGRFVVSAIHPDSFERPDQGHFVVSRVGASPTQITLKALAQRHAACGPHRRCGSRQQCYQHAFARQCRRSTRRHLAPRCQG